MWKEKKRRKKKDTKRKDRRKERRKKVYRQGTERTEETESEEGLGTTVTFSGEQTPFEWLDSAMHAVRETREEWKGRKPEKKID